MKKSLSIICLITILSINIISTPIAGASTLKNVEKVRPIQKNIDLDVTFPNGGDWSDQDWIPAVQAIENTDTSIVSITGQSLSNIDGATVQYELTVTGVQTGKVYYNKSEDYVIGNPGFQIKLDTSGSKDKQLELLFRVNSVDNPESSNYGHAIIKLKTPNVK